MRPIPQNILAVFNDLLKQRHVSPTLLADYRKWLFYFLDFRAKYPLPDAPSDQVRLFADKLCSKNQTAGQVEQAADAISLFFASHPAGKTSPSVVTKSTSVATAQWRQCEGKGDVNRNSAAAIAAPQMVCDPPGGFQFMPPQRSGKQYDEWRCLRKT